MLCKNGRAKPLKEKRKENTTGFGVFAPPQVNTLLKWNNNFHQKACV